jgi:hypothetical protein
METNRTTAYLKQATAVAGVRKPLRVLEPQQKKQILEKQKILKETLKTEENLKLVMTNFGMMILTKKPILSYKDSIGMNPNYILNLITEWKMNSYLRFLRDQGYVRDDGLSLIETDLTC